MTVLRSAGVETSMVGYVSAAVASKSDTHSRVKGGRGMSKSNTGYHSHQTKKRVKRIVHEIWDTITSEGYVGIVLRC